MKNLTRYKSQFSQKWKGRNSNWEWEQIWRQQLLQSVQRERERGKEGNWQPARQPLLGNVLATPWYASSPCSTAYLPGNMRSKWTPRRRQRQWVVSVPVPASCLLLTMTMTRQVLSPSPGCLTGSRSAGGELRVKFKTVITPQLSHASFLPQGTRASTFHVPLMFLV